MFNTLIADITYNQIAQFCQTWPEGVRVEYKREPADIPKVISSFANTSGGIWVIGVETDKTTNMPKMPITGMPRKTGIEEQIVQSAHTGIYPAITPDVRVFEVEGKPGQIIVLVKVLESIEAPHAIENSTRVYVRVASTTPPYDLVDIDRIEYLLKRREKPEQRREELIAQMADRSTVRSSKVARVRVIVTPLYPRGILFPHDMLAERAEELKMTPGMIYLREYRLIHNAIMSMEENHYLEADVHGIFFFEAHAETQGNAGTKETPIPFIHLIHLLRLPARILRHAIQFLRGVTTNVLIRYELLGWQGIGFLPLSYSSYPDPGGTATMTKCVNSHVAVSTPAVLETLPHRRIELLTEIVKQVLFAFNCSYPDLQNKVDKTLRDADLI